jgi:hypothetical protein
MNGHHHAADAFQSPLRRKDSLRQALQVTSGPWQKALPYARGRLGIRRPRGNKNALKHGRYAREAIAERAHIRELVRQARKLLLQIE